MSYISFFKFTIILIDLNLLLGCVDMKIDKKKTLLECRPEALLIEDVGWSHFLDNWDKQFMSLFKQAYLEFGYNPDPEISNVKDDLITELNFLGLDESYLDIFEGGVKFSSTLSTEENEIADKRWGRIREYVKKKVSKKKDGYGQDEIDNNNISGIRIDNYIMTVEDAIIFNNSLAFPPASLKQIKDEELRLANKPDISLFGPSKEYQSLAEKLQGTDKILLPESYKNFVMESNGWLYIGSLITNNTLISYFDNAILPIQRLDYAISNMDGQGLWDMETWDNSAVSLSDHKTKTNYQNIPTSIYFSGYYYSALVSYFDMSSNVTDTHANVYMVDAQDTALLGEYESFSKFMENQYIGSISSMCALLKQLKRKYQ